MLDQTDKAILQILQEDARKPVKLIAELLGVSRATVQKRLSLLEQNDVIRGYTIRTGAGYETEKFQTQVLLKVRKSIGDQLIRFLKSIPEVTKVFSISGAYDACVLLEASHAEAIDMALCRLRQHPEVTETNSFLILSKKMDRTATTSPIAEERGIKTT